MATGGLPIGRFSPAPGIWVDRTERSVRITGAMELYGAEANAERALSVQNAINNAWTQNFTDGYSVTCNIRVRYRGAGSSASANVAQIEAARTSGPSNVSTLPGMDHKMTLNASENGAFTWTPAHEFGHVIGMQDRYSETIMSRVRGTFGGHRTTTAHRGYETNLMAVSGGGLQRQNVVDLAAENEPSPFWVNDDDQVRNWLNAHSRSEIGRLSTMSKIRAIRTLMGGWISDSDVRAIGRICDSVTTRNEADKLRAAINMLDFTSIGPRTQVRVIFSRMP